MPATKVKTKWSSGNLLFTKTDGTVIMTVDGTNRDINIPTGATLTVVDGIAGTTTYGLVGVMAAAGTGEANTVGVEASASRTDHVHALGTHDHSGATKGGNIGAATVASITLTGDIDMQTSGSGSYDLILKDDVADALSIRRAATDVIVFDTATPRVTITPATTVTGLVTASAGITVSTGGITVSAGGVTVTGDSTITGALTVSGALNWGGATVIGNSLTVDELLLDTDGTAPAGGHSAGHLAYSQSGNALYISVPTGDTVDLQVNATTEMQVGAALTVINEASNDRDFRVESAGLQYALYVDGGKDAVVIGGNTDVSDADTSLRISTVAKTATNNENFAVLWVQPVGSTTMLGTNAIMASAYFKEPDLTDPGGGGAATEAATVYIADAPTEGDANYALMVKSGAVAIASGAVTISAGALTVDGGAFTFNDASADLDFRVETNALQYAIYADGLKDCVVIGDNTDISDVDYRLMVGNVAKTLADNQSASILYVAPTATTTESGAGTHAYIATAYFAEPNITGAAAATTVGATVYINDAPTEAGLNAALYVAAGATMLAGTSYIGDTANANVTLGLTINQAGSDDIILGLKSSDVATGLTTIVSGTVETDDFATFSKFAAATGGLMVQVLGHNAAVTSNLVLESYGGQADTTKSTAGRGLAEIYVTQHDGANGLSDIGANGNAFVVRGRRGGADVALSILDEDGDLWLGGGLTTTTGVTVTGGQVIAASDATEIGINVTNAALTVGSLGSIVAPYRSSIDSAFDNAAGGNLNGCFGFQYDSDTGPTSTLEARINGSWLSVSLAGIEIQGKTIGGSKNRGEKWHDNQLLGDNFVDETVCVKCGRQMKVGDEIVLVANFERKTRDGDRSLHAVFGHKDC